MSKTDEIVVTLELTQREVNALRTLTLRGASWGRNGTFGKDVCAISTALAPYTRRSEYHLLYPSFYTPSDGFPIWTEL